MRRMTVTGNIVKDAEAKNINGSNVIQFTVCVNEKFNDKQGNKQENAYYYDCSIWRDDTNVSKYMKKGVKMLVEGTPEVNQWTDKDGKPRAGIRIRVSMWEFQSSANTQSVANPQTSTNGSGMQQNTDFQNQGSASDGSDLPF